MSFPIVINQFFWKKQLLLFGILLLIHHVGNLLFHLKNIQKVVFRKAVVDNVTHMCIGIISWLIFTSSEKCSTRLAYECLICGVFASLIDLDHFVAAKSFRLKDAVSLESRAPLHNTTLLVALTSLFLSLAIAARCGTAQKMGWLFLVAVVSHHLRDSLHRGLYLWPYSTQRISFILVLLCSYFFPLALGLLLYNTWFDTDVEKKTGPLIV